MDNGQKIVGVIDIIFSSVTRNVTIRGGDGRVYLAAEHVANALRAATYCEMRTVVGAGALLETVANPGQGVQGPAEVVVGFVKAQAAGDVDENGLDAVNDVDRAIAESAMVGPDKICAVRNVWRPKLERYGVAVEVYDDELYAYPLDSRGAISPVGTLVARPSPEFLADVNAALGIALTLADFPAAVVEGR